MMHDNLGSVLFHFGSSYFYLLDLINLAFDKVLNYLIIRFSLSYFLLQLFRYCHIQYNLFNENQCFHLSMCWFHICSHLFVLKSLYLKYHGI